MTKVDIKRLDSITKNDITATEQINDNFEALQEAIENTLSRDGTGPNFMDADLDMNSYRIINSADPVEDNDIVNLKYVEERIGGAVEASNTAVSAATQAANSAQSALVSSTEAINTLRNAENTINQATTLLTETQEYVDAAKADIDDTVEAGKQEINTTIDDAQMSLSDTIQQSVEEVKQAALDAAQESINDAAAQATAIVVDYANNEVKPELMSYATSADEDARAAEDWANTSKIWATGEDAEVETIAPGEEEHSSRGYADLAMAIANTPENIPVDASTLLALDVIRGPKGDSGEAEFNGDVNFEGSFNVHGDDNHPVKVTSLAGTSASGYQVVDSNGAGDSDFEHAATGDRYITRITNHNNTSNTSVSVDLYQSNVGRSVLDLSAVETILAPALLGAMYPVGSIYITTNATCPIADLGVGTWELVAEDRVLQGAGARGTVGTELAESLPNITGGFNTLGTYGFDVFSAASDAFALNASSKNTYNANTAKDNQDGKYAGINFNASRSSSTYQNGAPVQPDAYLVNIFRRIQ